MGQHDEYGKMVVRKAVGNAFSDCGPSLEIDFDGNGKARIDGTINNMIAVEIESRVSKQIRGALLDLICHDFKKKLLILLPVHMNNIDETARQCRHILGKFLPQSNYQVISLEGSGDNHKAVTDAQIILTAIRKLGFNGA